MRHHIKRINKLAEQSDKSLSFFSDLRDKINKHNELLVAAINDMRADIDRLVELKHKAQLTKDQNQRSMNHISKIIGEE